MSETRSSGGKPIAFLDRYAYVQFRGDRRHRILLGTVYGHPCLADGCVIHTSRVLEFYVAAEGARAETLNTSYRLLRPLEGELPWPWCEIVERVDAR